MTQDWGALGRKDWRKVVGMRVQYRSLEEMETAVHLPGGSGGCSWLRAYHWEPPCLMSCSALGLSSSKFFAEPAVADAFVSVGDAGSGFPSASGPASVH